MEVRKWASVELHLPIIFEKFPSGLLTDTERETVLNKLKGRHLTNASIFKYITVHSGFSNTFRFY